MADFELDPLADTDLPPDLAFHIRRLNQISSNLRFDGILLALLTFVQMFVFVFLMTKLRSNDYFFPSPFHVIFILALANILLLLIRDVLKRAGDSLFEEITDELQWSVIAGPRSDRSRGRPPLAIRYTLRTYTKASALPILDGEAGPTTYGLLVIITLVASAYLQYLRQ